MLKLARKISLFLKIITEGFIPYKKDSLNKIKRERDNIDTNKIYVCIHEWGKYPIVREKNVKGIKRFQCGLQYQLERFSRNFHTQDIDITLTMSDADYFRDWEVIAGKYDRLIQVSNTGLDFSGFSSFYEQIKRKSNSYVILTNSSINKEIHPFLDSYINYMNENKDIGLLGISSNSRFYHTIAKWNFNPHIQSFFILTTIDVLKEIVKLNGNVFPGANETNKHLLIRKGEVGISSLALRLGYNLGVVLPDGNVVKFNYNDYPLPKGDLRKNFQNPNAIYPVRQ